MKRSRHSRSFEDAAARRMRSFGYCTASGIILLLRSRMRILSSSRKSVPFTGFCRVLRRHSLSFYTPSFLLSFHTRFSGTSVSPLIVRSVGLWRMTRSFFSSTTRSPIILLDASDRSFYYLLSFFLSLFHSSSMSRFSVTLLSPLPLSRSLSASSLRFMFTLTQTGNTEIENVDSPNAKPGRYPHHRPAIRLFTGR